MPITAIGARGAFERAAMRGGVDAEREPRDDREPRVRQRASEAPRVLDALRRRAAAADYRDGAHLQQFQTSLYI